MTNEDSAEDRVDRERMQNARDMIGFAQDFLDLDEEEWALFAAFVEASCSHPKHSDRVVMLAALLATDRLKATKQ